MKIGQNQPINVTAWVDNQGPYPCRLILEQDRDTVLSNGEPDRNWSTVDSRGHVHAYNQDAWDDPQKAAYPTLRRRIEERPCTYPDHDEDCTGENITHWHCLICDEEIFPGWAAGPIGVVIDRRLRWTVEIDHPVPADRFGEPVSVVVEQRGPNGLLFGPMFGTGMIRPVELTITPDGIAGDFLIDGVGEVGRCASTWRSRSSGVTTGR